MSDDPCSYLPTEAEIADHCLAFQASWSSDERRRRMVARTHVRLAFDAAEVERAAREAMELRLTQARESLAG